MKQQLLEMVQGILGSMGSDLVNDISDTEESYAVALLIKQVYYDSITEMDLAEHETLFQLEPMSDSENMPAVMSLPLRVTDVAWIKYNDKLIKFVDLEAFQSEHTTSGSLIQTVTNKRSETFKFRYDPLRDPKVFTSFDDTTMVFDGVDMEHDHSLQASKAYGFGYAYPDWKMTNDFIPELKARHFPYLINRAKVRAHAEIMLTSNKEAASETRNQKLHIRRQSAALEDGLTLFDRRPKWGRKRRR